MVAMDLWIEPGALGPGADRGWSRPAMDLPGHTFHWLRRRYGRAGEVSLWWIERPAPVQPGFHLIARDAVPKRRGRWEPLYPLRTCTGLAMVDQRYRLYCRDPAVARVLREPTLGDALSDLDVTGIVALDDVVCVFGGSGREGPEPHARVEALARTIVTELR